MIRRTSRGFSLTRRALSSFALPLLLALNFVPSAFAAEPKIAGKISTSRARTTRSSFTLPTKVRKLRSTDTVTLLVGSYTFEVSGSTFRRSAKKNTYQYTAKRGSLGLVSVTLDGKARTIGFVVLGVPLIDQRYPLRIDVAIGAVRSCELLGGQGKGSVTKASLLLRRLGRCPSHGESLTSSVGLLTLGVRTETIFRLDAAAAVSGLAVYTGDASGASFTKICDMSDKGDLSTGDPIAGDNSYACTVSLTPAALGKQFFVARGKRGGAVTFPGPAIQTITQITELDAQAALSTQTSALDLWLSTSASMGVTASARLETIQKILALPGVVSAGLAPSGIDIVLTMASGLDVILVLNTKPASSSAAGSPAFGTQSVGFDRSLRRSSAMRPRSGGTALKIFLYDPGYFPGLENETITAFAAAAEPGEVEFTVVRDSNAKDVHSLDAATAFDFVLVTTHGSIDANGRVGFVVPLRDAAQIAEYLPLLQSGKIVLSGTQNIGPGILHSGVLVMPDYFLSLPGNFQNTTVIGSSCYSAANGSMASALLTKGAAAYLGYDEVVFSDFAAEKANEFFCSTLIEKKSVGEAYNALSPKTDDTPFIESGEIPTNATVRFAGNPAALITQNASFDTFKILLDPPKLLLFHGESAPLTISIGGQKLPPCLKFRVRNNSSEIVTVSRQQGAGPSIPVGEELFGDDKLTFTAGTTNGVADLSTYLVREDSEAIVGQRKPTIEVLCPEPTVGTLAPETGTIQIGQEARFSFTELSAPGCDLRIGFDIIAVTESGGIVSNENTCGAPLNSGIVALPEMGGWSIPASQLPLRLSTADCVNARKINVLYNIYIPGQSDPQFDEARFLNELPLVSPVILRKDQDIQSGSFETKFILYTREVPPFEPLDRFYAATLPFITPPAPGQIARYCLKIDTHGIPGPDNQQSALPGPADQEYLVVSEDVCERLNESPGFYTPTPAECQGWMGGKMALFGFGPGNNVGSYFTALLGESPGCVDRCTTSQALDYYAPLRSWSYTARRLTQSQFNCSSP